jgi:hypothetical protein
MRGRIFDRDDIDETEDDGNWNDEMDQYCGNTYNFIESTMWSGEYTIDSSDPHVRLWAWQPEWIDWEVCPCDGCTQKGDRCLTCDKAE